MKLLPTQQVIKMLGVTRMTLYKWRKAGILKSVMTPTGRLRYEETEIVKLINGNINKNSILYARVSFKTQRNDIERQLSRIKEWAVNNNFNVSYEFTEIASGLNSKRRILNKMLDIISNGSISYLIIEHKDRLTRFGFEFLERYCSNFGCEIIVVDKSEVREDIVKDLIDIIICFSSKLYGKRTSRSKAKNFIETEMKQYD